MNSEPGREEKGRISSPLVSINQLKPGMEDIAVRVRVLEVGKPRKIETKKGSRTIANAVVGDTTGRVEVVLWGLKTTSLKQGDVVEISHAWVSEFRGKVQLNIGKNTVIKQLSQDAVPEDIPETTPEVKPAQGRPERRAPYPRRARRRGEESE